MSDGIDATVVLGLAGKTVQVFARPEAYLSFSLAPIGIERSRLQAIISDPLSPEGVRASAEFSLLVNQVPDGPLWAPLGEPLLWDVYRDVLAGAQLAEATLTAEEEEDYHRAVDLLHHTNPDGSVVDSPTLVAYQAHRDAYWAAVQEYNNRKGQAESPAEAAVRHQWELDEPILRERITEAGQGWLTDGHRAEVKEAYRLLVRLDSRSPPTVWKHYLRLFDPYAPELFFRTTPDNSMYVPTTYTPSNALDIAWSTITVTGDELAGLAAKAPEGLRSRLSGSSANAAILSLSFQYSFVTVKRPWFTRKVFASRAWCFHEQGRVLSDGGSPPAGDCTAYVTGLVLAREISVTRKATAKPTTSHLGFVPTAEVLSMAYVTRRAMGYAAALREMQRRVSPVASAAQPARPAVASMPAVAKILSVRRPMVVPPPPSASPETGSTTTTDPNHVYVLAFECWLLPKSPNPDPALNW